ncbi:MAG TPA: ATP-binding cassette domain-containing protein [Puia sp.]|jgi:ABC-type multidrug transport system ATPase subunit
MKITLTDAGKRFNRDWIFRHFHYEFIVSHSYAITGPNGSGKSTLLQALAGSIGVSEGAVAYGGDEAGPDGGRMAIPADEIFQHLSIAAPYLEVIEEMTAAEFLQFHASFKPLLPGWTVADILMRVGLGGATGKQIRYFSSGMKQRVRLAQAIFSDVPLVLLDEPCTNLDKEGIALYRQLMEEQGRGRLIVVSSNDPQEYDFCEKIISVMDHKT